VNIIAAHLFAFVPKKPGKGAVRLLCRSIQGKKRKNPCKLGAGRGPGPLNIRRERKPRHSKVRRPFPDTKIFRRCLRGAESEMLCVIDAHRFGKLPGLYSCPRIDSQRLSPSSKGAGGFGVSNRRDLVRRTPVNNQTRASGQIFHGCLSEPGEGDWWRFLNRENRFADPAAAQSGDGCAAVCTIASILAGLCYLKIPATPRALAEYPIP